MSFEARYHGTTCPTCDELIAPGQMVHYDEVGHLVHDSCPEPVDLDAPRRNERRCGECFTIHAGECM